MDNASIVNASAHGHSQVEGYEAKGKNIGYVLGMLSHLAKSLKISDKVGIHASSRRLDIGMGTLGDLPYVGKEFTIGEEMDREIIINENSVLVDDGVTVLKSGHNCTAIVVKNGL